MLTQLTDQIPTGTILLGGEGLLTETLPQVMDVTPSASFLHHTEPHFLPTPYFGIALHKVEVVQLSLFGTARNMF
jgi:hypothetical protein